MSDRTRWMTSLVIFYKECCAWHASAACSGTPAAQKPGIKPVRSRGWCWEKVVGFGESGSSWKKWKEGFFLVCLFKMVIFLPDSFPTVHQHWNMCACFFPTTSAAASLSFERWSKIVWIMTDSFPSRFVPCDHWRSKNTGTRTGNLR